ncbi:MAG: ribosome recycling factor [Burkholderiaceae bacterium]|jgi:ribosome recycling factor|nr:ribosome recycling factor [Pseudomonadota bacterium]MDP4576537.1 ribosome recycling factor [Burkholderiaceae bacterium]MDP4669851.1 ribosome recycling factor [Burkholderiaceae bacterium]MDP4800809.1 ribosome recycling factor [Burkholderiaceae bacterium]
MSIQDVRQAAEQKMSKTFDALRASLSKIRTGRAHPGLLENIMVDYYGTPTALGQVATLTLMDARTIGVSPWEKKLVGPIEKAIRESDLGLNPATSGESIRVPMPALTEERRRELTKVVKSDGEDGKVAIRNVRRDANEQLKRLLKDKLISEDEERRAQDDIQKLTDRFVADIEKALTQKESEIMTV